MMKRSVVLVAVISLLVAAVGCSRMQKGAVIGSSTGAVVGGVIGKQAGNTAVGAILGAAIGGAAGAHIGRQMDKQAEEIRRDLAGAKVERVGEGIKVTFDSGILFDIDKAALRPEARANLDHLAVILKKYADTDILIEGHTDSQGSEEHNLGLSRNRAQSVSNHLAGLGVATARFSIMGYGEGQPVASNESAEGRQQNRRVELAIMANNKMKNEAEKMAG
jgi:outer membrane protein OmpA-like peptidoglycan-associated protein